MTTSQQIFTMSFIDGFTMSGLLGKTPPPWAERDGSKELLAASVDHEILQRIMRAHSGESRIAMSGLTCGALALVACLGLYVYFVYHAHPKLAATLLSVWIIAIIGSFIATLFRSKAYR